MLDITKASALMISDAVRKREVSAEEVCEYFIRVAEADKNGAYITVMEDTALEAARCVDAMVKDGSTDLPLAGVPLSVKDNICTAGVRTTCASRFLEDFVPSYSATVYDRLIKAGAIPIGKTNMDEFAVGSDGTTSYFGKCTNPSDATHTPGGSSSGSAASLVSGSAVVSLGSDTGGSARIPASFCGLTSLKPTYGSVSRYGLVGMAPSLEQICPMTHSVDDNKLLYNVIRGFDERDMTTYTSLGCKRRKRNSDKKLTIGVFLPKDATDIAVSAVSNASDYLKDAGHHLNCVALPYDEDILGVYYTVSSAEVSSNLARFDGIRYGYRSASGDITDARTEGFGTALRERLAEGAYVLSHNNGATYVRALEIMEEVRREMLFLFEECDIILTPMTDETAPLFGKGLPNGDRYAVYANLSGCPAISVTAKTDKNGFPIGVQLIGAHGEEDTVYRAAEIIEKGRCTL